VQLLLRQEEVVSSMRFLHRTAMEWAQPETRCGGLSYLDGAISEAGRVKAVEYLQR